MELNERGGPAGRAWAYGGERTRAGARNALGGADYSLRG